MKMAGCSFEDMKHLDAKSAQEALNAVYKPLGIAWLPSLGFENEEQLVMLESQADQLKIRNMDDLRRQASQLTFGANLEYFLRDWRYPTLNRAGIQFRHTFDDMDINRRLVGLFEGRFDVGVLSETDPEALDPRLRRIEYDDSFPKLPQYAMPVCRAELLDVDLGGGQNLESILGRVQLTVDEVRELNLKAARARVVSADAYALAGIVGKYLREHVLEH